VAQYHDYGREIVACSEKLGTATVRNRPTIVPHSYIPEVLDAQMRMVPHHEVKPFVREVLQ
jgi:hypothetical protein